MADTKEVIAESKKGGGLRVAAMDLGTNSSRLLIADENGKTVYRDVKHVALGEGLAETGHFCQRAMERAVCSFMNFAEMCEAYGVVKYRAIATAACRMSKNAKDFINEVKKTSGIEVEVISEYEEARLTLLGAALNAKDKGKYLFVYDLGGGSTELTLALNESEPKILATLSIPLGARNATEMFGLKDYDQAGALALEKEVSNYVEKFLDKIKGFDYAGKTEFIATSSTPLRLVAGHCGMPKYDKFQADGKEIGAASLDKLIARILKMSYEERCACSYIGKNRAGIFVAALIIFRAIYQGIGADKLTASLKGAQEAIAAELLAEEKRVCA